MLYIIWFYGSRHKYGGANNKCHWDVFCGNGHQHGSNVCHGYVCESIEYYGVTDLNMGLINAVEMHSMILDVDRSLMNGVTITWNLACSSITDTHRHIGISHRYYIYIYKLHIFYDLKLGLQICIQLSHCHILYLYAKTFYYYVDISEIVSCSMVNTCDICKALNRKVQ